MGKFCRIYVPCFAGVPDALWSDSHADCLTIRALLNSCVCIDQRQLCFVLGILWRDSVQLLVTSAVCMPQRVSLVGVSPPGPLVSASAHNPE